MDYRNKGTLGVSRLVNTVMCWKGAVPKKGHKDSMYSPNHLILCLMYFFHVAVPEYPL